MSRPSWPIYFMRIAYAYAMRASCPRKQVGTVIVRDRDKRIISGGYNGAPRGMPSCDEVGCDVRPLPGGNPKGNCVRTLHAESNALDLCGPLAESHTMYITVPPCRECAMRIVQAANIHRVVYHEWYESRGTHEVIAMFARRDPSTIEELMAKYGPDVAPVVRVSFEQLDLPIEYLKPTYSMFEPDLPVPGA